MNGAPSVLIDANPNGRGYLLWFRPCHKTEYLPNMQGDLPKIYPTRLAAQFAATETVIKYGWPRMTGTQDGIPKRHTVDSVFGKGA